ncbi:cytochrome P450 [Thelephora ganbajun]|uniref:Cytochrome P450 n=1 Tax=Thelephora ganbajun TaxID=370292 RepID=A0ACB6Z7D2_THEGA|nr:cytochrome P450 [Thelephora ganbajun]
MPGGVTNQIRENQEILRLLAGGRIADKPHALEVGKGNRDIMTLLFKANKSQDPKTRLSEHETIYQIWSTLSLNLGWCRSLLNPRYTLAVHGTILNAMSFMLWGLAKHQDAQAYLRHEIESVRVTNGGAPSTLARLSIRKSGCYPITSRERFHFYATLHNTIRRSREDDILSRFEPIKTQAGTLVTHVPLVLSLAAYNRPERWPEGEEKVGPNIGGYYNLLSFRTGPYKRIGQQFAVLELRTFLAELILNFEFSIRNEKSEKVRRSPGGVMTLVGSGEEAKGVQMPLKVSLAPVN